MGKPWIPTNWDEACKRNAGRRKLHMRKRHERADRIVRLLKVFHEVPELRETSYGWLAIAAEKMKKSRATASRDFALCRRIQSEFILIFGRVFNPKTDRIVWTWSWSHYGFQTSESTRAGHRKPVGDFPFDTRAVVEDDAYCGFTPRSWQRREIPTQYEHNRDLLSLLRSVGRLKI